MPVCAVDAASGVAFNTFASEVPVKAGAPEDAPETSAATLLLLCVVFNVVTFSLEMADVVFEVAVVVSADVVDS